MDLGLTDKVAVVTGSSRGLGLASARSLVAEGCRVCLCARGAEQLAEAALEVEAAAKRPNQVMTVLSNANAAGFSFKGRDAATVTTAALYVPGSVHSVKIANPTLRRTVTLAANAVGRLVIVVNPRTLFGSAGTTTVTVS